jgi:hypothetical protein
MGLLQLQHSVAEQLRYDGQLGPAKLFRTTSVCSVVSNDELNLMAVEPLAWSALA